MAKHSGQNFEIKKKTKQKNFQPMKTKQKKKKWKAGSNQTKGSKSILYWHTKLCTASGNLAYTTNLLEYICKLCTWFVTP